MLFPALRPAAKLVGGEAASILAGILRLIRSEPPSGDAAR